MIDDLIIPAAMTWLVSLGFIIVAVSAYRSWKDGFRFFSMILVAMLVPYAALIVSWGAEIGGRS